MRPVIVPLDGSALSSAALIPAARLALARNLPVHLVHVPTEAVAIPSLLSVANTHRGRPRTFAPERAETYLEELATDLRDRWRLAVTPVVTPRAEPAEVSQTLADYAAVVEASLVVLSTRGHSGLARLVLGSVADGLLRHSQTPLLLYPPGAARLRTTRPQLFRRVLVPLDGSRAAEGVMEHLELVPHSAQTQFALLRVVAPVSAAGDVPLGGSDALSELKHSLIAVRSDLAETAARMAASFPEVRTQVQVAPLPVEAILAFARHWEADLIAMTSSGRGGLERLRLGSVAAQLVGAAPCPLLVACATPAGAAGSG